MNVFGGWNRFYGESAVFHESTDRPKLERNPPEAKIKIAFYKIVISANFILKSP
jgi:hypothetical protein